MVDFIEFLFLSTKTFREFEQVTSYTKVDRVRMHQSRSVIYKILYNPSGSLSAVDIHNKQTHQLLNLERYDY